MGRGSLEFTSGFSGGRLGLRASPGSQPARSLNPPCSVPVNARSGLSTSFPDREDSASGLSILDGKETERPDSEWRR